MTITTTVTWEDLLAACDDELAQLRDAYDEVVSVAEERYGEDALEELTPGDTLAVLQQRAEAYNEAAKSVQKRRHVLERLRNEYGGGDFEIKMLTGTETMDIETELRMLAERNGVGVEQVQVRRNGLVVDAATVGAPEGVPSDEDGPTPSECPNALTLSLWERVERYNNSGATDFQPEGFGDTHEVRSSPDVTSPTPTPSETPSSTSED